MMRLQLVSLFFFLLSAFPSFGNAQASQACAQAAEDYRQAARALLEVEHNLQTLENEKREKEAWLSSHLKLLQGALAKLYQLRLREQALCPLHREQKDVMQRKSLMKGVLYTLQRQISTTESHLKALKVACQKERLLHQKAEEDLARYESKKLQLEDQLKKVPSRLPAGKKPRRLPGAALSAKAKQAQTLAAFLRELDLDSPQKQGVPQDLPCIRPVEGALVLEFGQKDERSPAGAGVVFRARPDSFVSSPVQGLILFAAVFRNYKNIVILSDEKGSHFIIAGIHKLLVKPHQIIEAGEILGKTDPAEKSYVYFEIIRNKKPVPPRFQEQTQP